MLKSTETSEKFKSLMEDASHIAIYICVNANIGIIGVNLEQQKNLYYYF